ncbi:MAG: hypothetical protein GY798_08285, partial [Hyphomicrobiales bacterium]|nr:hypothetical protein [Hyphomicrobiales bacterium]
MTDKGSDNIDLIGPVSKAPAPEDEAASPQSPPTDHPEALPSPETLKERDPTEQNRPADGGSLL